MNSLEIYRIIFHFKINSFGEISHVVGLDEAEKHNIENERVRDAQAYLLIRKYEEF